MALSTHITRLLGQRPYYLRLWSILRLRVIFSTGSLSFSPELPEYPGVRALRADSRPIHHYQSPVDTLRHSLQNKSCNILCPKPQAIPQGPCTQRVYTLVPMYLHRECFKAKVYTIGVHGPLGNVGKQITPRSRSLHPEA